MCFLFWARPSQYLLVPDIGEEEVSCIKPECPSRLLTLIFFLFFFDAAFSLPDVLSDLGNPF